jgi:hypothetical protein
MLMKDILGMLERVKQENRNNLFEAHKKAQEAAAVKRRRSGKRIGSVGLSNTDSVSRAVRIKSRLYAKLDEIFASDLEPAAKLTLAKDVIMKINKVEQKIIAIKRREKALQEEKIAKRDESEQAKRRRRRDMIKKSISIDKGYLFSAQDGGMDPMAFGMPAFGDPSVSFEISGVSGAAAAVSTEAAVEMSV